MKIAGSVVFITGANRGIGLETARQALARGAVEVGEEAVVVDEVSRQVKATLSGGVYLKDVIAG